MYCPRCGQQHTSSEMRFCSRCGFPLEGVRELLAVNGFLPSLEVETGKKGMSPRRRGVGQGAFLVSVGAVLVPMLGAIDAPEELVAMMAVLFFVGGLMRMLYAALFQEGAATKTKQRESTTYTPPMRVEQSNASQRGVALPSSSSSPIPAFTQPPTTAEIIHSPSVTEGTTRLLDKQPD